MNRLPALLLVGALAPSAHASGACCSMMLSPGGRGMTAAVYGTVADSTEHTSLGEVDLEQSAVSAKLAFPVYERLGATLLAGAVLRSEFSGLLSRRGHGGHMYGLQLGLPVWLDVHRELDVSWSAGWSRSKGDVGGGQDVVITEVQTSLTASKCFGPVDGTVGARFFHGELDLEGGAAPLDGEREGHFAALVGARVHLGEESRSLALEYGFGPVRTLAAGLSFSF